MVTGPQRIVLYGTGGIGKTTLASLVSEVGIKPLILDIDQGSGRINVDRIGDIESFEELRDVLHSDSIWQTYNAVVLDALTKAEELATSWVVRNVKHEKGLPIEGIEDYGWGKGFTHLYDAMVQLLGDLDNHVRAGRHVIAICHDCTATVPNPMGENWIRFEPRLYTSDKGKSSVRHRVKEWADHLLFIGYDVAVNNDGKGKGAGTRTIYPAEMPTHMAKSRFLASPIPYEAGSSELWRKLFVSKGE